MRKPRRASEATDGSVLAELTTFSFPCEFGERVVKVRRGWVGYQPFAYPNSAVPTPGYADSSPTRVVQARCRRYSFPCLEVRDEPYTRRDSFSVHADRTARRHCHHRHPHRTSAARSAKGPRRRRTHPVR